MTLADTNTAEFGLEIRPTGGRIGAEIANIDLSGSLQPATVRAIKQAAFKHKVIFFRGQTHLSDQEQERFAALLGAPVAHPTVPVADGTGYILELDSAHGGRANSWHTDVTFVDAYPQFSILRAIKVPEAGGDTQWANTAAAYADLPDELKALAERLWAVHSNAYDYAARNNAATAEARERYQKVFTSTIYETEHPLVRIHPETGEKTLILGHFLQKIKGYSTADSQRLFEIFQGYVIRPENIARWRWQVGDVAIWDNRATQHYALNDYGDQHRVMRRVTIAGDVPVSVDGRNSRTTRREINRTPESAAA